MLQHRLVWEREHGKKLGKRVVHHVNGDPQDNRIENLKAMSASDHSKLHAEERRRANGGRPKRKLVNFRLPVDLCGAIMRAAEEEGISQTAWVEQALREALALEPGEPVERSEEPQDEVVAVVVSSPAAPEPGDFSPRDGWVEARMKELEHSVPSAAARRALALREWRANGG